MRLVRFGTSLAVFAILGTLAACSETLAPKLERVQAQIANALTCSINWTGAAIEADNDWRNPGNWAPPRAPAAGDNVCITSDGAFAQLFGTVDVNSITVGTPASSSPAWLAIRGTGIGSTGPEISAFLTVANGIENHGRVTIDNTGRGAVRVRLTGGAFENRGRFDAYGPNFGVGTTTLMHWLDGNVVNDGLIDFFASMEMTGTWTNRGAVKFRQTPYASEQPYFFNLNGGTFDQVSGGLIVVGTFEVRDGRFRLESGVISGDEGPIVLRGSFEIADNVANSSGNITLRQNVAMSGSVPADLTVIMAGHAYSTTGFFIPTVVNVASGFTNKGTLRLTSTGHSMGTPATLNVANGAIDNYGRIESAVGNFNSAGRFINANITNRAGAVIDIQSGTEFNKAGAAYENHGTISVTPSTFVTLNGAPSFLQDGALTLGTDAQWKQDRGSFRLASGAITGRPWLAGTTFDIPAGSPATGTLRLTHVTTMTGDVPASVTLHVEAFREFNGLEGVLSAAASYTNFGTIVVGDPGFNPTAHRLVMLNGATLTNRGRIETVFDPSGNHRYITGNLTNEGTLQLDNWTQFAGTIRSLAPAIVSGTGLFDLQPGATLHGSGNWAVQLVNRGNLFVGAPGSAGALQLREYSGANGSSVTMDLGGSPSAPGTDFDRMTMAGPMTFGSATLNVRALDGACIDGGTAYDVIAYSHPSGNFTSFTGLDLGGGRTVQPEQLPAGYRLNVIGPVCPPPVPPPTVDVIVTGTLGLEGWYTSDVTVEWKANDGTSHVGCEDQHVTADTPGVTYTCTVTNSAGSTTRSVTIKRDATPPAITTSQSPMPNANGWNNSDVTAMWTATDAMSGLEGPADKQNVFTGEGLRMNFGGRYFDKAGNEAVALIYASIDRTPPVVTVTRSPLAGPDGWNATDVTATWTATDDRSGIDGASSATLLFDTEGANQTATRSFSDLAGNTAGATISGINIRRTAPPPPPGNVSCSATPNEIWPPNNKMVAVRVTIAGGIPKLLSVTNNETGTADAEGWAIGTADLDGSVRASRNGGGTGRTYTLSYQVGTGSCAVTVRVPHDQRK